jgi:predicted alpha/beta hydrolase family esterase
MRASELDLLFAPDLGGAPSDHWQVRWAARLSTSRSIAFARGVEDYDAWVEAVARSASSAGRPIVFIAHSVGALAVSHAASRLGSLDVRGAFLVAPPSDAALLTIVTEPWPATPRARLPWPSLLVASRTDPWASAEHSRELAEAWGSTFVDAGEAGRIDAESGHGPWPDGLLRLAGFLKRL